MSLPLCSESLLLTDNFLNWPQWVVISRLDIGIGWYTLIEYEAVAMLHAVALESIVGFFI